MVVLLKTDTDIFVTDFSTIFKKFLDFYWYWNEKNVNVYIYIYIYIYIYEKITDWKNTTNCENIYKWIKPNTDNVFN